MILMKVFKLRAEHKRVKSQGKQRCFSLVPEGKQHGFQTSLKAEGILKATTKKSTATGCQPCHFCRQEYRRQGLKRGSRLVGYSRFLNRWHQWLGKGNCACKHLIWALLCKKEQYSTGLVKQYLCH